jgi:hypothetical protein
MTEQQRRDGGPAFPGYQRVPLVDEKGRQQESVVAYSPGMTLRDWFAGQALAGGFWHHPYDDIANQCYIIANAMLAEREKGTETE